MAHATNENAVIFLIEAPKLLNARSCVYHISPVTSRRNCCNGVSLVLGSQISCSRAEVPTGIQSVEDAPMMDAPMLETEGRQPPPPMDDEEVRLSPKRRCIRKTE